MTGCSNRICPPLKNGSPFSGNSLNESAGACRNRVVRSASSPQIASTSGLDATYGLKIWITRCDQSSGANGWTETSTGVSHPVEAIAKIQTHSAALAKAAADADKVSEITARLTESGASVHPAREISEGQGGTPFGWIIEGQRA